VGVGMRYSESPGVYPKGSSVRANNTPQQIGTKGLPRASNTLTSMAGQPSLGVVLCKAQPISGGVTASTEMLAAKRHAGVHTPVIVGKMIIANQQMAYAA